MRINRLKFQAVGPFKDEFEIDFDALGESGLYLIDGPTGAGKTTIVDCIVYALYNTVSVSGADDSRIRSNFATATDKTEVELDFTTSKGKFRVRRSPKYWRQKSRGEGLTPVDATATLARLDVNNNEVTPLLAQGVSAVGIEIPKLIGLGRAQFSQTMVLPQGEFAEFLRSDTKSRSELLKKIFGIEIYTKFTELISTKAQDVLMYDEQLKSNLKSDLNLLQERLEFDDSELNALANLVETREADELLKEIAAHKQTLDEEEKRVDQTVQRLDSEFRTARELLELRRQEEESLHQLEISRRSLEESTELEMQSLQKLKEFKVLCKEFTIETVQQDIDYWTGKKTEVDATSGNLQELVPTENFVLAWPEEEGALISKIEAEIDKFVQADEALTEIKAKLDTIGEIEVGINAKETAKRDVQRELDRVNGEKEAIEQIHQIKINIRDLEQVREEKNASVERARAELTDSRKDLLESSAARLARDLKPGHACAVCGSNVHPQPALPGEKHVTESMVDEYDGKLKIAEEEHRRIVQQISDETRRLDILKEPIKLSLEETNEKIIEITKALENLDGEHRELINARNEKTALDIRRESLIAEKTGASEEKSRLESELNVKRENISTSKHRIHEAKGTYDSIQEKHTELLNLSQTLGEVSSMSAARTQAENHYRIAQQTHDRLAQHEFFGDVESAQGAFNQKNSELNGASTEYGIILQNLSRISEIERRISETLAIRAEANKENLELLEFARVIRRNDDYVSLEIYVLQQIFEQVLEAANLRFKQLLDGRYRLVPRPSDDEKGGGQKGLGINVLDLAQNQERVAKTLSGGETFCAALALALGLADVVQSQAGGITIGTLFIDEGFGTLDSDRLDIVMGMLEGIQSLGRTIGIISHVDELKARIPERINVSVAEIGVPSTLSVSWA